jgi:hypothetical protein
MMVPAMTMHVPSFEDEPLYADLPLQDFVDIASIRVAPTSQELSCRLEGFLPANLYDAPHPLPAGSMERLLDIQFRLLREELTCVVRKVQLRFG